MNAMTAFPYDLSSFEAATGELARVLMQRGLMLATAESCTGGLIGAVCTALPGSSSWFERGFVTYSNDSKRQLLGVPHEVLGQHGAVSRETAEAMARGAVARSKAQVGVAVTGVAGPGGGSSDKPVGTVWVAVALLDLSSGVSVDIAGDMPGCVSGGMSGNISVRAELLRLAGDRSAVRGQTVARALAMVLEAVQRADDQGADA